MLSIFIVFVIVIVCIILRFQKMLTHCFFCLKDPENKQFFLPDKKNCLLLLLLLFSFLLLYCYCYCYCYCNCLYHLTIIKDADSLFSIFRIPRTSSSSCPTRRWLRSSAPIAFEALAWQSTFPLTFLLFNLNEFNL